MTAPPRRIVCIGECMVEFYRGAGGTWHQGFAGDTLNVAWAMRAILPAETWAVAYLTRVGGDAFSDELLAFLEQSGIATDLIQRDTARTLGLYTITTDDEGERSFAYWRSASAARGLADDNEAIAAALGSADLVYLSGISLAILPPDRRAALIAALGRPGKRPFRLAFDPNIRPGLWEDAATIRHTITQVAAVSDIVLPTFADEAAAFGDANAQASLDRYRQAGAAEIIVKDGLAPTLFHSSTGTDTVPVAAPQAPIDTTGAGDSFNGIYLASRMANASPEQAVGAAQAAAARVVMQRGALAPYDVLRTAVAG